MNTIASSQNAVWDKSDQVHHVTAAAGGRYILISTVALVNKPKPGTGRLFVFDVEKGEIVRTIDPVAGAPGAGWIVGVGPPGSTRVLGWTADPTSKIDAKEVAALPSHKRADYGSSILYGVDAATGEVCFRKPLPYPYPVRFPSHEKEPLDFRLGPDGNVWTFIDEVLVRIHPGDVRIEVIGRTAFEGWQKTGGAGRIAFSGRDVYLAGFTQLRVVRGAVPGK